MNSYFYRLSIYDEYGSIVTDDSGDFDRIHEALDQAKEDIEIYDSEFIRDNGYNHCDSYDYQDKGLVIPDKDHRVIVTPTKEEEKEPEQEWELVPIKIIDKDDEDDVVVATLL